MDDVTELIRELAEVNNQIWALPDDAFAEKYELQQRRDALRRQAEEYAVDADKERATGDLLAELSGLRMQLGQIEGQKIDLVTQAGGGATGASNNDESGWCVVECSDDGSLRCRSATGSHRRHQRCPSRQRCGRTSRRLTRHIEAPMDDPDGRIRSRLLPEMGGSGACEMPRTSTCPKPSLPSVQVADVESGRRSRH